MTYFVGGLGDTELDNLGEFVYNRGTPKEVNMEQQFKANVSVPFDGTMDVMVTLRDDDDEALFARIQWWFANLLDMNISPKVMGQAPAKTPVPVAEESKTPPRKSQGKAAPETQGDADEVLVQRTSRDTLTFCLSESGDKLFTKIKCGEWRAHGVKAWPEVYDPFDMEISVDLVGKTYDLPKEIIAIKVQVENGKPKKVTGFLVDEPA